LLFQLQASVRGIKGKESGFLPTPTTMDHIDRKGMRPSRAATNRKTGYLSEMIKMFPTPTAIQRPTEGNVRLMRNQVLSGNLTKEEASAMVGKDVFQSHGKLPMYNTPTTNDHKNLTFPKSQKNRTLIVGNMIQQQKIKPGGKLNPNFVEFLMGYPMNWTKIEPTE